MRITHNKVGQNLNIRDSQKTDSKNDVGATAKTGTPAAALGDLAGNSGSSAASEASRVQLSQRAQDMKRSKEIAMNSPDINEQRVAELQKLIDEGKYKTDSKAIADKMVDEYLAWE